MISFTIPGNPASVTAQQKGQNRRTGKYYKPPELRDAEQKYLSYAALYRPTVPLEGAIQLTVSFVWDARGKHANGEPKITKPDTDNAVKALKDALTKAGFWKDDAQVACELVYKTWSSVPRVTVMVRTWDEWMEVLLDDELPEV